MHHGGEGIWLGFEVAGHIASEVWKQESGIRLSNFFGPLSVTYFFQQSSTLAEFQNTANG